MKALQNCVLLLISGLVLSSAQNDATTHPTTTSTEPSTSTERTTKPTTTTSTPTTKPTTTPIHTTTEAPVTTTTPSTTSTAEPPKSTTPVPEPDVGSWTFTNQTTNQTCVLTQMAIQLNVTYINTANKPVHTLYDVPKNSHVVNGSCAKDVQYIQIGWGPASITQALVNISFMRNATEFSLAGLHFTLNIFGEEFPDAKENQTLTLFNDQVLFKTPLDMSYHCNRPQLFNLTSVDKTGFNATATVSKLQFEAFHTKHNSKFSIAKDCDAIDTPDIVPIAVGCALILLIVIVLIAYLAGRRSSRSRGYVSM